MEKKTILLIEDDPKTEAVVREALGREYKLEAVKDGKAATDCLEKKSPDLILIDFDLKGKDGLQVFKELQPPSKVIMLSASGSIPIAVSATKIGVSDFLRKPINAEQLRSSVEKNILRQARKLRWGKGMEWLRGESPKVKKMFSEIQEALENSRDIILVGERGIPKERVAEFIHLNGPKRERRLARIDLSSFRREALESHFWANLQELVTLPDASSLQSEEELYGTLYLENLENLEGLFKVSIFNFFKDRKGKVDKSIRAIIGVYDRSELKDIKIKDHYAIIEISPLRERKEDLFFLLEFYLKRYSIKYNRNIKSISRDLLDLLATYDYPGNYVELERLIQEAVLEGVSERLELKNFPLAFKGILQASLKKGLGESLTLEESKRRFEKILYSVLLKKLDRESSQVARFLDVPKNTLIERIEDLVD